MRRVRVEATADPGEPLGGSAIVRLLGVDAGTEQITYRLRPLGSGREPGAAWPTGERSPKTVRSTERGLELVLGPDVVDSPELLPGTMVAISADALDVDGEFLWPDVAPSPQPKRRIRFSVPAPQATNSASEMP
ncbi:MAG: hypothetical protein RL291_1835, partial [Pseudomonadota bacterium]